MFYGLLGWSKKWFDHLFQIMSAVLSWGPFNDQWFQITFPWTRETGNTWTAGLMALHKLGESTQIWQTITMTTSQSKIKACEKIGPIQMKPKFANCMSELWTRLCTKQIVALTYKNGLLSHISTSSEEAHIWQMIPPTPSLRRRTPLSMFPFVGTPANVGGTQKSLDPHIQVGLRSPRYKNGSYLAVQSLNLGHITSFCLCRVFFHLSGFFFLSYIDLFLSHLSGIFSYMYAGPSLRSQHPWRGY